MKATPPLIAAAAAALTLAGLAAFKAGLFAPGQPMKKLVFRKAVSGAEPSLTMTLYRIGSKFGRLEERAAPGSEVLQVIAVREPDIWQIDPKSKIARHTRDTGPYLDFHSPIIPPDPGSQETLAAYRGKPLSSFEFGRELEFMMNNGASLSGPEEVRGVACDRYSTSMDGYTLVVLVRSQTESVRETRVLKDGKTLSSFEYDSYEPSLPADLSLFTPPKGFSLLESSQETSGPREQGPGAAIIDKKAEQAALAALSKFSGHPWRMIVCGPALWKRLLALDAGLSSKGSPSAFLAGKGGRTEKVPVRRFFGAGKKIDDSGLYESAGFQLLAKSFGAGKARSASNTERAALYSTLPFEITGRPLTLIEAKGDTLVFFEGGGLLWLDLATR